MEKVSINSVNINKQNDYLKNNEEETKIVNLEENNVSAETQVRQSKSTMRKFKCENNPFIFILPEDFKVYVNGNKVINHPYEGFEERILPTFNEYQGIDGGYVAIYSKNKEGSVYEICDGIYVIGQVRVKGNYQKRVFIPEGYKPGDNITNDPDILEICQKYFPEKKGEMWIGGDTGGWFGIQENGDIIIGK